MQRPAGYSANPKLVLRCLLLLPAILLLPAVSARAAENPLPPCHDRPTFRDPPWVDTSRFCPELVFQTARNEALALVALTVAPDGTLYAASPQRGEIRALRDSDGDGLPDAAQMLLTGLVRPSALAWHDDALFISAADGIWRLRADEREPELLVADLPRLAGQADGDLVIDGQGNMYLSLAAPCSACDAGDAPSVLVIAPDGRRRTLARGLRQPAGLALRHGELWATDVVGRAAAGRGDALDEINRIEPGAHYGWPWCVGAQRLPAQPGTVDCETTAAPALALPTGSYPLGLAWYDHAALPGLQDSLLVTLHGSRHRITLRGYALAVIRLDENGQPLAPEVILPQETAGLNFSVSKMNYRGSGFWPERPLDVAVSPEGWIYVSVTGGRILALRPA